MRSPPLRAPGAGTRVWALQGLGGTAQPQPQPGLELPVLKAMQELVPAPVVGFGSEPAQGRL